MGKVLNIFFGIGAAVLVYVVVLLGIQAFYHDVNYEDYNCTYPMAKEIYADLGGCSTNMTVAQCLDYRNKNPDILGNFSETEKQYRECDERFQNDMKDYNKNLFLITAIVGAILIYVGITFIPLVNISAGVSFAGLALIIYGFARGWTSTGDLLKFIVAVIVATLVIWLGIRFSKKDKRR